MGEILFLSLLAALNPTLLAATTVMLLLQHPGRLMLGYWVGAMLMSVTLGLIIVFVLEDSSVASTTKTTVSPAANFVLAVLMWILAGVLATGGGKRVEEGRRKRKAKRQVDKEPPKWQQQLSKGTARTTFVIGALLSLPGATYLAALTNLSKLDYANSVTVLVVILFNLIQLLLIEVPLVALKVAPDQTPILIERAKAWAQTHGREYGVWALVVLGVLFAIKGLVEAL
jgi:Sap, sulfolipid-1-addressing protein